MTNAPGADSYPISGVTWLLVYQKQDERRKGKKMVEFLKWALTKGEDMADAARLRPAAPQDASRPCASSGYRRFTRCGG